MIPSMTVDHTQWRRAATELFRTSSRSCVDFTNGQALKVSIEAVRNTKKANREAIRAELSAVTKGASFAQKILGARFRKTGKWGVPGQTTAQRVRNLIASRARSAGFIASGWIPSRRKLFSVVRQKPPGAGVSFAGARQYGKEKGYAVPAAIGGLRLPIVAHIANQALVDSPRLPPATGGDPMPEAKAGLQTALNIAAKDMIETLRKRLQRDLAQFNARR